MFIHVISVYTHKNQTKRSVIFLFLSVYFSFFCFSPIFFLTSYTQREIAITDPPLDRPIQAICIIFRNKDVDFYEMVLISHLWHEIITVSQSTKFVTVLNIVFWTVLLHKCVLLVLQLSVSNF
mgnify:CR=1 FL=1